MRSLGLPELIVILGMFAFSVVPLIAAVWLLLMVSRIKQDVQEIKALLRRGPMPD